MVAHTGFEPVISSLRGRCPKPLDECAVADHFSNCSQSSQIIFTQELFNKFLESRPSGISIRISEACHYTLDKSIGYPFTPEALSQYLNSLSCRNGKLKFYSCLRALCNWLYGNGYIPHNPIKKVFAPKTSRKLLPAVTEEQLRTLLSHCYCERDKARVK